MSRRLIALVLAVVSTVTFVVASPPPPVSAAPAWVEGSPEYSAVASCSSIIFSGSQVAGGWVVQSPPLVGYGVGAFAAQSVDVPAGQPKVGQVFYIRLYAAGITQPCTTQLVFPEFSLPSGVSLAISGANPMQCWFNNQQTACPSTLPQGAFGQYGVPSTGPYGAWPVGAGQTVDIRVPVVSNRALTGEPLPTFFKVIDGHDSPVLTPDLGLTVFPTTAGGQGAGAQLAASVNYPEPSADEISDTAARLTAWIQPGPNGGSVQAHIYSDPGLTNLLGSGNVVPLAANSAGYTLTTLLTSLNPGTTLYWQVVLTPNGGGSPVYGAAQSFRTLGAGEVTLFSGQCTEAGLRAAVDAEATRVSFDCGTLPVTIPLTSQLVLPRSIEIDGGGLVSIALSSASRSGQIRLGDNGLADSPEWISGSTVTLRNLTITRTANSSGCGGLVYVGTNMNLELDSVTMRAGVAELGGGLCVSETGTATILNSSLVGNRATGEPGFPSEALGGAIFNRGYLDVRNSEITGNVAARGGGIYNTGVGTTALERSAVLSNVASDKGGGLYAYSGGVELIHSTFGVNRAAEGAAIFRDNGAMPSWSPLLRHLTIADNQTTNAGSGAIDLRGTTGDMANTIIGPQAVGRGCAPFSFSSSFASMSGNLDAGATCGLSAAWGTSNSDVRLGPLALNSGGTRSFSLRFGSTAIDTAGTPDCSWSDQRYVDDGNGLRGVDGNGDGVAACDVGSFELSPGDFQAIAPRRYLDSRSTGTTFDGQYQGPGLLPAGSVTEVQINGRGGINLPNASDAVALNITATGATSAGFVTVFPCGATRPTASNLNAPAGRAVANSVVTAVGTNGRVCLFNSQPMHLIVDVTGVLAPTDVKVLASARRLLDTRPGQSTFDGQFAGVGRRAAGTVTELPVGARAAAGQLRSGSSVLVNVTAVNPAGQGFITVYPCGTARPNASTLNFAAGETTPNATWTSLRAEGPVSTTLCLYNSVAVDLIVDLAAYASPVDNDLSTMQPARLIDTRAGQLTVDGQQQGVGLRPAGSTTEVQVSGRAGLSVDTEAVMLNVVGVGASGNGFITVYPCGTERPGTSTLNVVATTPRANGMTVELGLDGKVCLYNSVAMHLIVDVGGSVTHGR